MASAPQSGGRDTTPFHPPKRLLDALSDAPEGSVRDWLEALPETVDQLLDAWELTPERVVTPGGRRGLVTLVRQADGTPAALKLPVPGPDAERERAALAHWDGWGAARLLRADPDTGALLIERLSSAVSVRSLPEAKALLEAAGTVRRLWVPPPEEHPFGSVAERTGEGHDAMLPLPTGGWAADARPLAEEAAQLRTELLAGPPETVLLHGDFRQGKVLAGERSPWLAVGPSPLVGERAYDLAQLVLDRCEDLAAGPGPAAAARRRVAKLADSLDVDRDRLRGWTLYRAVATGLHHAAAGHRSRAELLLEFANWL
ncbi:aminoglycoside phosphotransferase family protein [Streptomyces sp. NEAU-Y11]|uniref:aminoglycoside phosphotransferase family protein n=1 Tax=Streptomyces cucumeris TaxID=2962890 RepID=UPI0020C83339|nr:aminoglycoside phosphotransferase family protein [Streptomyces sp. NEAU-Y11]MCP9209391.1 aminoglycoside phosphotransferase family protein [Streptomyces sp. NEAU-Y11]